MELLVVIAIIGILVALLLPAVQAAREAARRMQCTNNLKQIGLAQHNYHDTHKSFTSGWIHFDKVEPAWGWGAFLLPFIEQQSLHDGLRVGVVAPPGGPNGNGSQAEPYYTLSQTVLTGYRCPSDTGPDLTPDDDSTRLGNTSLSNYIVAIRTCKSSASTDGVPVPFTTSTDPRKGGFYGNSKTRIRDILDGTTNTIAVSERVYAYVGQTIPVEAAQWVGAGRSRKETRASRCVGFSPEAPINEGGRSRTTCSSNHPGGVNAALFDGSVRFISENIDHFPEDREDDPIDSVFEYLIGISNGNVVNLP